MKLQIAVLPGDGIGPEIVTQALKTLDAVARVFDHELTIRQGLIGGAALDEKATPLPMETIDMCASCDAVLLGAVGGPKWETLDPSLRPERGLLSIRSHFNLFANLRPAKIWPELASSTLLRPDISARGVDLLVVRELTGGIYFGKPSGIDTRDGKRTAYNTMIYNEDEIRRVARVAFEAARKRRKNVCSVDKANVLDVSRLWREVVHEAHAEYKDVTLWDLYVDNTAMQLVRDPSQFDVMLTPNLFGDILSDEASVITGSIGMLPSASLGDGKFGLYEPIHGSAPDIAGQDKANPLATILSVGMMLLHTFGLKNEAQSIENAVGQVLKEGYRTGDLARTENDTLVSCSEMGRLVAERIKAENK